MVIQRFITTLAENYYVHNTTDIQELGKTAVFGVGVTDAWRLEVSQRVTGHQMDSYVGTPVSMILKPYDAIKLARDIFVTIPTHLMMDTKEKRDILRMAVKSLDMIGRILKNEDKADGREEVR